MGTTQATWRRPRRITSRRQSGMMDTSREVQMGGNKHQTVLLETCRHRKFIHFLSFLQKATQITLKIHYFKNAYIKCVCNFSFLHRFAPE